MDGNAINDIQADHLGTPRAVVDRSRNNVIWRWNIMGEVFGADAPQEDPDKDGQAYVLDMRFPGQRYDRYTGLFQNWYRDYDPASGRYVQSDPIGLMAGVSTYSYAHSSSLSTSDRLGLDDSQCMFNREACGWPSPVQKHTNASFGIGETGAAALAIQSSEFGIAFDSTPNMCFYATVCGSVGTGIGAGGAVGITASLGTGALSSGQNDTAQFAVRYWRCSCGWSDSPI